MQANLGRGAGQSKAQVEDRIGKFRWIEDAAGRQQIFDLELNAFETGCVVRWLERRWARGADLAGTSLVLQNSRLHLQLTQSLGASSASVPVTFETWMRRLTRLADQ